MTEYRGLVMHIAAGYYEGTISWQRNPKSKVSSHFIGGRKPGQLAQIVDTSHVAWTQSDGNGHWLSYEAEGFLPGHPLWVPGWHELSAAQIESAARVFARGHREYGYPLQLAGTPAGHGLGYHSMGAENGYDWGHSACPGAAIKAQLPLVVARAKQIAADPGSESGDDMTPQELLALIQDPAVARQLRAIAWQYVGGGIPAGKSTLGVLADIHAAVTDGGTIELSPEQLEQLATLMTAKIGDQIKAAVRAELDRTVFRSQ